MAEDCCACSLSRLLTLKTAHERGHGLIDWVGRFVAVEVEGPDLAEVLQIASLAGLVVRLAANV